jgi:polar amino acid transport system permease protein
VNLDVVLDARWLLLGGLLATVTLSVQAIVAGTALGLVVALLRSLRVPGLRPLLRVYIEVFRGSPLLIQLFFVYFGAATIGLDAVDAALAAAIALTLYEGAYIAEIFRAGIESVPAGQSEAARVLGLSGVQTFVRVVLPQGLRVSRAPLVGQYIGLVKDTSLATAIGYAELLRQGQSIVDRAGHPLEVYTAIALGYFLICFPLSLIVRRMDREALVLT